MNRVQSFTTALRSLLAAHRTSDSAACTHMSMKGGKYLFEDAAAADQLYGAIADVIRASSGSESIVDTAELDIIERCPNVTNLHIDLDLSYSPDSDRYEGGRYYSASQVNSFVLAVEKVLQETLVACDRKNHTCYLMERPEGYAKDANTFREGVHLMFPRIVLDRPSREVLYRCLSQDADVQAAVFRFGTRDSRSVLDPATVAHNNGWFLFGCGKPGRQVYRVTGVFEYMYDIDADQLVYRRAPRVPELGLEEGMRLFSIRNVTAPTPLREGLRPRSDGSGDGSSSCRHLHRHTEYPDEDKQKWIDLVELVDAARAATYEDWRKYMVILCDMNPAYQEVWDAFSRRCPDKYSQEVQDRAWREYATVCRSVATDDGNATVGTIIYHARNDNPIEFARWKTRYANAGSYAELTVRTDVNFAKVISEYILCRECIYVADSPTNNNGEWYRFDGVVWKRLEPSMLYQFIYNNNPATPCHTCLVELVNQEIAKLKTALSERSAAGTADGSGGAPSREGVDGSAAAAARQPRTDPEIHFIESEYTAHCKVCRELQTSRMQSNIVRSMQNYNHISYSKFALEFNVNPDVVVFQNGIYDLARRQFRLATIADRNTFQMSVNYVPLAELEQRPDYAAKKAILDNFFETTFIDKRIRQYVLTILAGMFHGANKWNHMYIWTGSGSNGKSVLLQFLYHVFGEYATTVSVSMFTKKRGESGSASPDIMHTMARRLVTMQEPDDDDRFHTGLIKEMTGNDVISARELYKSQVTFQPMFKVVCCCNNLPRIDNADDGGIWRRIRVIPFETKFLSEEDYRAHRDEPKVKPMDANISEKLRDCAEIFANILLQKYFALYYDSEPVEPEPVRAACNNYRHCADVITEFIDECVTVTDDEDNAVAKAELWDAFRAWHEHFQGSRYTRSASDFYASFVQKLRGKCTSTKTHFSNIRLTTDSDADPQLLY